MYCRNCGEKAGQHDKYCANCGVVLKPTQTKSEQNKLDLLKGLDSWANKKLKENPGLKPFLALQDMLKQYAKGYGAGSKLLRLMPKDTQKYIFHYEYVSILNTPLNQDEMENLTSAEKQSFDKKTIPILNDIRTDIIAIGYLYRIFFGVHTPANDNIDIGPILASRNPQDYMQRLLKSNSPPDMFADSGFNFPYGVHMVLGLGNDGGLFPTLEKNIEKLDSTAKVFILPGHQNVMLLFMLGWCLARYDIGRKTKV